MKLIPNPAEAYGVGATNEIHQQNVATFVATDTVTSGDLVVSGSATSPVPDSVNVRCQPTATAGEVEWLGVALEAAAAGDLVRVAMTGSICKARVAGGTSRGDVLSSSTTLGVGAADVTWGADNYAVALSAVDGDGFAVVRVL